MAIRKTFIRNGDEVIPYYIFNCKKCGKEIGEEETMEIYGNEIYCGDCAFLLGIINEKQLLKKHYFYLNVDNCKAEIKDGKVYVGIGRLFQEKTSRDRECKEYREWRKNVFERDNYTCQRCGKIGGILNAHHIKPYSRYQDLRYVVDNGLTLCENCHKNIHKKRGVSFG